jgi:hypothetical protein
MKQGTATRPIRQETAPQKTGSAAEANNPTTNPGSVQHDRQSARPPQSRSSTQTVEAPRKQSSPDESRIRQRAYELYVESGYSDGHAEEHWFMAEREIAEKGK